jgi:hypothetical protein
VLFTSFVSSFTFAVILIRFLVKIVQDYRFMDNGTEITFVFPNLKESLEFVFACYFYIHFG